MTLLENILPNLIEETIDFIPQLISAIIFLIAAFLLLKLMNKLLSKYLTKEVEEKALVQIGKLLFKILAYYAIILALLAILGLNELAASLGTAIGFLALGISFAMKNLIADMISGFYLIRDSDFCPGDKIKSDKGDGIIKEIGIKKTRLITEENDILVVSNSDLEKKWKKINEEKNKKDEESNN